MPVKRLLVLVSSRASLDQAGVRIRYQRMVEPLAASGWSLELRAIDDLGDDDLRVDALLLSKCQDARSIMLAQQAIAHGARVGVDLFDNYFSQHDDARFASQRRWLRALAPRLSFYVASTTPMHGIGADYIDAPGHVLLDPFERIDAATLAEAVHRKRAQFAADGVLRILWFGMGDNPNFPVGLHDLVGFSGMLDPLRSRGIKVDLEILTNARALDASGYRALRALPFDHRINIWSVDAEAAALDAAMVAFMPVNYSAFSTAKSLNRAVTALVSGTQLLSPAYDLYAPLADFLYRDAATFADDLARGTLRVSPDSVEALTSQLGQWADPTREGERLGAFLDTVVANRAAAAAGPIDGVMIGAESHGAVIHHARAAGVAVLGLPVARDGIAYDVHLGWFGPDRTPALRLGRAWAERLPAALREQAVPAPKEWGKGAALTLPVDALPPAIAAAMKEGPLATTPERLVRGPRLTRLAREFFETRFALGSLLLSEQDKDINAAMEAREIVEKVTP